LLHIADLWCGTCVPTWTSPLLKYMRRGCLGQEWQVKWSNRCGTASLPRISILELGKVRNQIKHFAIRIGSVSKVIAQYYAFIAIFFFYYYLI
jgi:hypothetical protein